MMLVPRKRDFNLFDNFFEDDLFHHSPMRYERAIMRADIRETKDKFIIDIDLPGFNKENINLSLNNGYLEITAKTEKKTNENKDEKFVREERFVGECSRTFYVGENTEYDDTYAEFKNGILTIEVKKKEDKDNSNKPKQIEIK